MNADNRSGFHYKRSENISSKVLGMHRKVDTKTLNKLFSDSWPTDYYENIIYSERTRELGPEGPKLAGASSSSNACGQ